MKLHDLATPAVVIDADLLQQNLSTMTRLLPGAALRPHVKAHKCTELAAMQHSQGHHGFTCATPREVIGLAEAGWGDDLLLANEVVHPERLRAMATAQRNARITVAVDSEATVDAAAAAGLREVVIDVNVGLPRCGCSPTDAGRLADRARSKGLAVRGVMGYEGHLMMVTDRDEQQRRVDASMALLAEAHALVGGELVSAGGTGTHHHHVDGRSPATEVQAGSYALMDTDYARLGLPFVQACWVLATVVSTGNGHAVVDVGLKAASTDHGNPTVVLADGSTPDVWFLSDEHLTFAAAPGTVRVGERVRVAPSHIDPTMAMHETAWLLMGDAIIDRWSIDLRGW